MKWSGDPESIRPIPEHFGPMIRDIVASYAPDRDDQDDLYQEVGIRILEQRTNYEEMGALPGWIATMTHRHCRNWRSAKRARRSARERYSVQSIPMEAAGGILDDPSRLLNYRDFLSRVQHCIQTLPARQAEALTLVHIEGRGSREAARVMKVSVATVRSHLRHARTKLRSAMEDYKNEMS